MTAPRMRRLTALLAGVAAVAAVTVLPAAAQDPTPIEGAADFRTAPIIGPGTYVETLVTGEHVWYSSLYTERETVSFEAALVGVDDPADVDVVITSSFVPPVLDPCVTDDASAWQASCFTFGGAGGGGHGELWYLTVGLETDGRQGRVFNLQFTIEGINDPGGDPCGVDCPLDEELAELDAEYERLQAEVDGTATDEGEAVADPADDGDAQALAEQRARLEQDMESLSAEIAVLCGPRVDDCDEPAPQGAEIPITALGVSALVAVAALGHFGLSLRRHDRAP